MGSEVSTALRGHEDWPPRAVAGTRDCRCIPLQSICGSGGFRQAKGEVSSSSAPVLSSYSRASAAVTRGCPAGCGRGNMDVEKQETDTGLPCLKSMAPERQRYIVVMFVLLSIVAGVATFVSTFPPTTDPAAYMVITSTVGSAQDRDMRAETHKQVAMSVQATTSQTEADGLVEKSTPGEVIESGRAEREEPDVQDHHAKPTDVTVEEVEHAESPSEPTVQPDARSPRAELDVKDSRTEDDGPELRASLESSPDDDSKDTMSTSPIDSGSPAPAKDASVQDSAADASSLASESREASPSDGQTPDAKNDMKDTLEHAEKETPGEHPKTMDGASTAEPAPANDGARPEQDGVREQETMPASETSKEGEGQEATRSLVAHPSIIAAETARRSPRDSCKLRACEESGNVRPLLCRFLYGAGPNPILNNETVVIYNKPLKQSSTTIYGLMMAWYEAYGYEAGNRPPLDAKLDKDVTRAISSPSAQRLAVELARKVKFWGWHIELSNTDLSILYRLRGNDDNFIISSLRDPPSQVVSYFFETKKNVPAEQISVEDLIGFIMRQGRNNNYAYHYGSPGSWAYTADCQQLDLTAKRAEVAQYVKRYDFLFSTNELSDDFDLFNRAFAVDPPIEGSENLRPGQYKLSDELIHSARVRAVIDANMCLDKIMYEELSRRRKFLEHLYRGNIDWGCDAQSDGALASASGIANDSARASTSLDLATVGSSVEQTSTPRAPVSVPQNSPIVTPTPLNSVELAPGTPTSAPMPLLPPTSAEKRSPSPPEQQNKVAGAVGHPSTFRNTRKQDPCRLSACLKSGSVRPLLCQYLFGGGTNPMLNNNTAVVYNKPMKQGSTTIYHRLKDYYELQGYRVGDKLDKNVTEFPHTSIPSAERLQLAREVKYWGWHMQLSAEHVEYFTKLRGNDDIFLITSLRDPFSQVVSYFFEAHKHESATELSVQDLVDFIGLQGKNNNYAYHYGLSGAWAYKANCSEIHKERIRWRSEIGAYVGRYDYVFHSDKLENDFRQLNRVFMIHPPIPGEGNLRKGQYKLPDDIIESEPVRRAFNEHMCLDRLFHEELFNRRTYLQRLYRDGDMGWRCPVS
ncbi:hypothetical protein FVE85_1061 [Porphyridium purpureum]|uniref:Uncharacterized protein n=1 Tax=Porphyridium purpureum TaxID=35688 RepID=A0A5J4Z2F8_PORPP|nr:hypothetical protein FVE85_1061 [Porphyridium purpureum]|eukprot:POR5307..scf208_2